MAFLNMKRQNNAYNLNRKALISIQVSPVENNSNITNGNNLDDKMRPLQQIQTYREYKEALRQQRAQDVGAIYRTKDAEFEGIQVSHAYKTEPNTPTHHHHHYQNQSQQISNNLASESQQDCQNHHHHHNQNVCSTTPSLNVNGRVTLATSRSDPTPLNAAAGPAATATLLSCPRNVYDDTVVNAIQGKEFVMRRKESPRGALASATGSNGNSPQRINNLSPTTYHVNGNCDGYIKPNSPIQNASGAMSHDNIPIGCHLSPNLNSKPGTPRQMNGANNSGVSTNSSLNNSQQKANGTSRATKTISWCRATNKDSTDSTTNLSTIHSKSADSADRMSFTMRREIDKAKEESELINQLKTVIETRLKMSLPEDLASSLTDGVVLCHLANHIRPRSVATIHVPSPAVPKLTMARCRRNVDNFLEACRKIGVDEEVLCSGIDVTEALGGRGLPRLYETVMALCQYETKLLDCYDEITHYRPEFYTTVNDVKLQHQCYRTKITDLLKTTMCCGLFICIAFILYIFPEENSV